MRTAAQIIEAFGGLAPVAAVTGANANAVRAWRRIGIPYRFWDVLVSEAGKVGIEGITYEALMSTKPVGRTDTRRVA